MNETNYNDVVVWLPTFNEEMNVLKMITDIQQLGFKVKITDGGSTDNTVMLARQLGIEVFMRAGKNKGYGIQQAMRESAKLGYKRLIYIDCDQTYPIERMPELYAETQNYDIVVGARDFSKIVFLNRMANHFFTGLINLFFFSKLKDTQSGMRALHIDKFIGQIHATAFDVEAELTCFALKAKLKMKEIPIDYHHRVGESKADLLQALLILRRILICRFLN